MAVVYTKAEKKNIIIRVSLLVALLIVLVVVIVIIVNSSKTKPGIVNISNDSSKHSGQLSDFDLNYYLEEEDLAKKQIQLERYYGEAFDKIYEQITPYEDVLGVNNIKYINDHPNQDIKVDSLLYDYLKKVYDLNPKYILSSSLYDYWQSMIYFGDVNQRTALEPENDQENKDMIEYFVNTSINHISLEFKDNNVVKLNIDDDYKKVYEDDIYISFNSFYDAVVMDYIKSYLKGFGFSNGFIVSENGYYLDFGMTSVTNNSKLTSKNYYDGYHILKLKANYSYINLYDYKVFKDYPYYEYNGNKRSLFINYDTGYSLDIYSSVFYSDKDIITTLSNLYKYYNNEVNINYLIQKDNKIITNDKTVTSDYLGVEYVE